MTGLRSSDAWVKATPVVFVLIWATGFIVARFGMPHAPPLSFLSMRYALSIACFGVWIVLAKVAWPQSRQQFLHLSVTGILMHAGYLGGVWVAVKAGMGSGLSSLVVGFQPVLTAIWLSYSLRGTDQPGISRRQWLGLCLGFVGLLMVVWRKLTLGTALDHVTPANMAFAVTALLSITVGTLYQKRFVQACDVRSANTVQLFAALVVTLPLALMETESMRWNAELVGAMAWSVLGLTLGGSSLLYLLIQRGAAASVTSLMYLVPPTTAMMAWFLFDESITLATLLGTALTAWGVSWVVRPSRAR
ncbi:DMT family transporter [Limnohabitans sp. G3-2]|uniref:DMT family transporter n=1 Tax=Limnohabitans sp. G3-2 TaxID=1100711 RepID=UPI000C1E5D90|nr:DMT family transporter [Limnohabitans sp. G3-2]PIT74957.1 EamA family transporter [Limnohabitans sp. G3-2]